MCITKFSLFQVLLYNHHNTIHNVFLSMILVVLVIADKAYKKGRLEYVIKKIIIIITNFFKMIDSCNALI